MKVIIAGSRGFLDYNAVVEAMAVAYPSCTEVVSGGARGADALGERFAGEKGLTLTVIPADWETLGKGAGFIRNTKMAKYADALLAMWDGSSHGTKHMIDQAYRMNLKVAVVTSSGRMQMNFNPTRKSFVLP